VCQSTGYAARYKLVEESLYFWQLRTMVSLDTWTKIRELSLVCERPGVVVPEELIVSVTLLGLGNRFGTLVTVITHVTADSG